MKLINYITGFFVIIAAFSACIKDDAPALGDKGDVFIKLLEAPTNNLFFSPFSTVDTFSVVSVRREETSIAGTNTPLTVTLMNDTAAITAYNEENGTAYVALPDDLYTLVGSSVTKSGNNYMVTIAPGTTGTELDIALDGSKWDPSIKYAMSLSVVDSAGTKIRTGSNMVFVTIEIKNEWDADYESTGYFYHPSSPRELSLIKHLSTVSPNSVACDLGDLGGAGYVALLTIDPETNKVTISDYTTGVEIVGLDELPSSNPGYTAAWDGSAECNNTYDPATKTFYLRMAYVGGTGWRVSEEILKRQ